MASGITTGRTTGGQVFLTSATENWLLVRDSHAGLAGDQRDCAAWAKLVALLRLDMLGGLNSQRMT